MKIVKTQQSTYNYTAPDDDQKYDRIRLAKRYEAISFIIYIPTLGK